MGQEAISSSGSYTVVSISLFVLLLSFVDCLVLLSSLLHTEAIYPPRNPIAAPAATNATDTKAVDGVDFLWTQLLHFPLLSSVRDLSCLRQTVHRQEEAIVVIKDKSSFFKLYIMAGTYHGLHDYSTFSASTISASKTNQGQNDLCGESENKGTFHRCCCFLCRLSSSLILHPVGPLRCIWDVFVMLLLIYTSIEIPYTMSFGTTTVIQHIGLTVDCLLLLDIFLNFHTAYFDKYDNLRLVTNKAYICKKYFRTWFLIDFITCIPFEFLFKENSNSEDEKASAYIYIKILRIFRLLRIIKILRFLKMLRIFDAFMKQFIVREVIVFMKLFKIIFGMLLFAHFAGCLWWFVGSNTAPSWIDKQGLRDNDSFTPWEQYSFAWYWAVVTLFTTGYGDIVATNMTEQWVSSICILIGTCFFAYFVGTLTVLITEGDKIKAYELEKLEEAQSFCERKKLPKELTRAILTHIRYHCTYNFVFDESELLNILPSYLQHDIHTYISKQFLLKLKIFNNKFIDLPDFIIGLIAIRTKSISCNQHYKLYDFGDFAKTFYIQRTGKSLLYNKHDEKLCELQRGSVCGEYSSFLFKKRKLKVECQTWSEFYSINIDDIKRILDEYYPKTSVSKWNKIKMYLKQSYKNNIKHEANLNTAQYQELYDHALYGSQQPTDINHSNIKIHHGYEESDVHLFDNTRRDSEKSRKLPSSPKIELNINADLDGITIITSDDTNGTTENINLSAPDIKKDKEEARISQMRATVASSSASVLKKKRQRISATRRSKFAKFRVRGNSELRHQVIVAHAEKHKKSNTPKVLKRKAVTRQKRADSAQAFQIEEAPKLRRFASDSILPSNLKSRRKSLEMSLVKEEEDNKAEDDIADSGIIEYGYTTVSGEDSECSYSVADDIDPNLTKQLSQHQPSKHRRKTQIKKRKKGKGGKFGGARGGTKSGAKGKQHRKMQLSHIGRGPSIKAQHSKKENVTKITTPPEIPKMNKNYTISLEERDKERTLSNVPNLAITMNLSDINNLSHGEFEGNHDGGITPFSATPPQ